MRNHYTVALAVASLSVVAVLFIGTLDAATVVQGRDGTYTGTATRTVISADSVRKDGETLRVPCSKSARGAVLHLPGNPDAGIPIDPCSTVTLDSTDILPIAGTTNHLVKKTATGWGDSLAIDDGTQLTMPAPTQPTAVGYPMSPLNRPIALAVVGNLVYVVNNVSATLCVYDVRVPSAPELLGGACTAIGYTPNAIAVIGQYAYVVSNASNMLTVMSVANPAAPTVVTSQSLAGGPISIVAGGRYIYVALYSANVVIPIDVSVPSAPKQMAAPAVGTHPRWIASDGRYIYTANAGASTVSVLDALDPTNLTVVGTTAAIADGPVALTTVGQRYVLTANYSGSTMSIIDVANHASPTVVKTVAVGTNPHSVAASGRYAAVGNYGASTVSIVDLSVIASAAVVGTVATGSNPYYTAMAGPLVFTANNSANSLSIIDLYSTIRTPALSADALQAGAVNVVGDVQVGGKGNVAGSFHIGGGVGIEGPASVGSLASGGPITWKTSSGAAFAMDNTATSTTTSTLHLPPNVAAGWWHSDASGNSAFTTPTPADIGAASSTHTHTVTDVSGAFPTPILTNPYLPYWNGTSFSNSTLQYATNHVDSSAFFRVTAASGAPASGGGLELFYNAGVDGYIQPYNRSSSTYGALYMYASKILLNGSSSGNVGIHTTEPDQALSVKGSIDWFGSSSGSIAASPASDGSYLEFNKTVRFPNFRTPTSASAATKVLYATDANGTTAWGSPADIGAQPALSLTQTYVPYANTTTTLADSKLRYDGTNMLVGTGADTAALLPGSAPGTATHQLGSATYPWYALHTVSAALYGSSSGHVVLQAAADTTNYNFTWPAATSTGGWLKNTSGTGSWSTPTAADVGAMPAPSLTTNRIPYATGAAALSDSPLERYSATVVHPYVDGTVDLGSNSRHFNIGYFKTLNAVGSTDWVTINGSVGEVWATKQLRLGSSTGDYTYLAATSGGSGNTFHLPANYGTAGDCMVGDGAGHMSWGTCGSGSGLSPNGVGDGSTYSVATFVNGQATALKEGVAVTDVGSLWAAGPASYVETSVAGTEVTVFDYSITVSANRYATISASVPVQMLSAIAGFTCTLRLYQDSSQVGYDIPLKPYPADWSGAIPSAMTFPMSIVGRSTLTSGATRHVYLKMVSSHSSPLCHVDANSAAMTITVLPN